MIPAFYANAQDPAPSASVADGKTAILTPDGAYVTPPPGAPLRISREDPANVTRVQNATAWGITDLRTLTPLDLIPRTNASPTGSAPASLTSCSEYETGWYETNSASLYGGHMGIHPQNMPPSFANYCSGSGMGYTDGVSFGTNSWIQAGLAIFPGETRAKWFCQSNDNGQITTLYGLANAYANGATVYTWFSRDSLGIWHTYRYDTGPASIELGCTIARGASGNLQTVGEIQLASSTSAQMGVWQMFDLRYQATSGSWFVPSQLQAYYPFATPCPPYGAGSVASGTITAGSGQACTTGTRAYPS